MECTAWLSTDTFNMHAAALISRTAVDDCRVVKILYFGMHESAAAVLREASRITWAVHALHKCRQVDTREEMIRALSMNLSTAHQVCKLNVTRKISAMKF